MILNFHTHHLVNDDNIVEVYNVDLKNSLKDPEEFNLGNYRCAGIHPWWIESFSDFSESEIKKILSHSGILCLGEIGLDRSFSDIDFSVQERFFMMQLEVAIARKDSFVVIHCVKAYQEILNCVKKTNFKGSLVFHDYNGPEEITKTLVSRGDYFSYGGMLFRDNSKGLKSLKHIPIERLFFETDDTVERSILDVYEKGAEILELSIENLITQCFQNFKRITS